MLAANIIHPSRSPCSFSVVVVDKKDDTKRFCTDFRKLNKISKKDSWPLPVIDDMLVDQGKVKYFKMLDLKSAYWKNPLDEEDKEKIVLPVTEVYTNAMSFLLIWQMPLEYSKNSHQ